MVERLLGRLIIWPLRKRMGLIWMRGTFRGLRTP